MQDASGIALSEWPWHRSLRFGGQPTRLTPRSAAGGGSYNANMAEKFREGGIPQRSKIKFCAPDRSTLDERLQPAQCLVPLPGYVVEVGFDAVDRLWPELVEALAPCPHAADEPGAFEYPQMLRHRLAREVRPLREFGNRLRRIFAELQTNDRRGAFVPNCKDLGTFPPSLAFIRAGGLR